MPPNVRIGASSWTSEAWWGRLYPERLAEGERLAWYARLYDTVEVDATYYAPPSPFLVDGWRRKTPEGFRFALKVPRELIDPRNAPSPGAIPRFVETVRRLGPKLGPLLLQFPPSFAPGRPAEAPPNLDVLAGRLAEFPDDLRVAVELRHRGWYEGRTRPRLLDLLARSRRALAWSSLTYVDIPPEVTSDWAYLRFIGDHETVPASEHGARRVDRTAETKRWADRLRTEDLPEAWAFFNNHYEGYAPDSMNVFRQELGLAAIDHRGPLARETLDTA